MKKEELRIGNLVGATLAGNTQPDESASEIDKRLFTEHGFVSHRIVNGSDIHNVEWYFPIPLTEEWLLKFGFKSDSTDEGERVGLTLFRDEWPKTISFTTKRFISINYSHPLPHIKYVHQLQNLVFALTGEELKVTQK